MIIIFIISILGLGFILESMFNERFEYEYNIKGFLKWIFSSIIKFYGEKHNKIESSEDE